MSTSKQPDQRVHRISPFSARADFPQDLLSVDVEDYFHVEAFADRISRNEWSAFTPRVRQNTQRILAIFQEYCCRATFFVLGWVAERDPRLIREIVDAGHEIACHSYHHRRVTTLSPAEFREDLRRARSTIQNAAGVRVHGYRAPTFSIGSQNLWALEILAEEGFLYDSSIFPIRHDLYGYPNSPRFPYQVQCREGKTILEIPMTTVRKWGLSWPVGGGGYLRLLPMTYTRWAIRRLRRLEHQPFVLYLHPWELDPEQPRINGKWKSKLRHYLGLGSMENRLRELLKQGSFIPLIDLVQKTVGTPLDSTTAPMPFSSPSD